MTQFLGSLRSVRVLRCVCKLAVHYIVFGKNVQSEEKNPETKTN